MSRKILQICFFAVLYVFVGMSLSAQSTMSWKKHVNAADDLFKKSDYAGAAEHYKAAWTQKSKKKELIYKAGESYYIVKDYKNAAEAFKNVKEDYKEYPLVGLKYARALKQSGDYDAASRELVYFLNNYKGADKDIISEIVQTEIRGCELGIKLTATPNEDVVVQHLNSNVNTPETEFSPYAYNDETIYYSSTMAARAAIYRSRKVKGVWTKPERPTGFPDIDNDHFCNGSLAPGGKRFYFTICQSKESWGGLTTECDLYVTKNKHGKWTKPERLRDYVNVEGATATHPYVIHKGNTELLYFSSNREGGKGGMDIWYMTRDLRTDDIDFTFPINCGSGINTKGDEITPYYDAEAGEIYFSSNALTTIGGYDIFRAVGEKTQWDTPQNVGVPLNSSADDFFFSRTPSRAGGFFVSNRLFGAEKISTTDEDIFSFTDSDAEPKIAVAGQVTDAKSGDVLGNVMVSLSKYMEGGMKKFMANENFEDGEYYFEVLPGAEYELEAQHEGYLPKTYVFSTREEGMRKAGKTLKMERVWDEPVSEIIPTENISKPAATSDDKPQPRVNTAPVATNTTTTVEESSIKATEKEDVSPSVKEVYSAVEEKINPATIESATTELVETKVPATTLPATTSPTTTLPTMTQVTETMPESTESSMNDDQSASVVESVVTNASEEGEKLMVAPDKSSTENTNSSAIKLREDYNPDKKVVVTMPETSSSSSTSSSTWRATEDSAISNEAITVDGVQFSAPRHNGTYYKVQLIAVTRHDPNARHYNDVRYLGRLDTEYIIDRGITRVLLADYFDYAEAKKVMNTVREERAFHRAYLVKYKDGYRIGRVK